MSEDYKRGEAAARDQIICLIIGLQNECVDKHGGEYLGMQKVLEAIESRCGAPFTDFKG